MKSIIFLILLSFSLKSQEPMKFSCGKKDTLFISAYVNANGKIALSINCTSHIHDELIGVTIGFTDGTHTEAKSLKCFEIDDQKKIVRHLFDYLSFDEILKSKACLNIRTKDYFLLFFENYNLN